MAEKITGELRLFLADPYREWMPKEKKDQELKDALDAIDAVHANLERENESLRHELDRVLGEREEAPTTIGSATVTITPRLDWSAVALELHSLACRLAGDAE